MSLPRLEVAAGLLFRGGKLLLARRRPEDHQGGLWEFPGGKREAGEDFPQCLERELREELGVKVRVRERLERISHSYPDRQVCLEFFRCELVEGEPRPIGCSEVAWVSEPELDDYEFPPADARLLMKLHNLPALWRSEAP